MNSSLKLPSLFFSFLLCQNIILAQCGFDSLILNNPQFITRLKIFEQEMNRKNTAILRGTVVIPIVVHVVWRTPEENISDAQIFSQLSILNRDFNAFNTDLENVPVLFKPLIGNGGIRFCLVTTDSLGNATTGIIRKQTNVSEIGLIDNLFYDNKNGSTAWNTKNYLNIWIANTGDFISGRGSLPLQVPVENDGVIIHPRYFGKNKTNRFGLGLVAVHEIGHYLGLYHLWGIRKDTTCASDEVDDTPTQKGPYYNCPVAPQYSCGQSNMFMNFMDYVDDPCMVFFTKGQMERMITTIQKFRSGLINISSKCQKPDQDKIIFSISPNPVLNSLVLTNNSDFPNLKIIISDLLSHQLFSQSVVSSNPKEIILDTTNLIAGYYFISIQSDNRIVFVQKFIKL